MVGVLSWSILYMPAVQLIGKGKNEGNEIIDMTEGQNNEGMKKGER